MDIRLDMGTGDFFVDERALPLEISGLEELLQRAFIAVAVPMGALPMAGNFGGDRHLVEKCKGLGKPEEGLLAMAENALCGDSFRREGLKVVAAELSDDGRRAVITVSTHSGDGSFEVIL